MAGRAHPDSEGARAAPEGMLLLGPHGRPKREEGASDAVHWGYHSVESERSSDVLDPIACVSTSTTQVNAEGGVTQECMGACLSTL